MRGIPFQILFLLLSWTLSAQAPEIEWSKTFGGSKVDIGVDIQSTSDGGYILAIKTASDDFDGEGNHGLNDYLIIKLTNSGEVEWKKVYGDSRFDNVYSIRQTVDGGYIVAGISETSNGLVDGWIIKLDDLGEIEWSKTYGEWNSNDGIFDIQLTSDGGYIAAGATGYIHNAEDCWVLKLDSFGELEWSRTYGGDFPDFAYSIKQTQDGGYVFSGSTESFHSGDPYTTDYWVVKIDNQGEVEWERSYGGSRSESAEEIIVTSDGGYALVGSSFSDDGDVTNHHGPIQEADIWVVKINSYGELEWENSLGGSEMEAGRSILQTPDNGYLVMGYAESDDGDVGENFGMLDAWLVKLNSNGELEWEQTYGGTGSETFNEGYLLPNGELIVIAQSTSADGDVPENRGFYDAWVVKFSAITAQVTDFDQTEIIVYPNPTNKLIRLSQQGTDLTVWDLTGKLILKAEPGDSVDTSKLTDGIYLLTGKTIDGENFSIRFIKKQN